MTITQKATPASSSKHEIKTSRIGVKWSHRIRVTLVYLVLIAGAIVLMIPFFWMLSTSLKTIDEVQTWPI